MSIVVPRIPTDADQFKPYFLKQEAVILEGFFEHQPISDLTTLDQARQLLDDVELNHAYEETFYFLQHGTIQPDSILPKITLSEYVDKHRDTPTVCYGPCPERLTALYEFPKFPGSFHANPPEPIEKTFYLGNPGIFTHLHFDEHMYSNILYQVFGEKRVTVFPPSSSRKLLPLGSFSLLFLQNLNKLEMDKFLSFADGAVATIRPGDALFIPAGWWHHVDYVDAALSVSTRFGRSRHISDLIDHLGYYHTTVEFQQVAAGLSIDGNTDPRYLAASERIKAESQKPHGSFSEKYWRIQGLLETLCAELLPESTRKIAWQGDINKELLESISSLKNGVGHERYLSHAKYWLKNGNIEFAIANCRKFLEFHPESELTHALVASLECPETSDLEASIDSLRGRKQENEGGS